MGGDKEVWVSKERVWIGSSSLLRFYTLYILYGDGRNEGVVELLRIPCSSSHSPRSSHGECFPPVTHALYIPTGCIIATK